MAWRTKVPCANCPFSESPEGKHLRKSLRREFWRQTKRDLMAGRHFICHKTTDQTGDGSLLICAGSIAWQADRGVVADAVQVCERLEILRAQEQDAGRREP